MPRQSMICVFVLLSSGLALAQGQASATRAHVAEPVCSMAVLDLKAGQGYSDKEALALTDVVSEHIGNHSKCSVLSRDEIRSVLSFEAEKQLLGCDDDGCMAELGGALGVDFLVVGSISRLGKSTLVSLKKIDLASLKVLRRITDTSDGTDAEIAVFVGWMATRLAAGDQVAGPKPKIKKKKQTVQLVEKQPTLWRNMAWTGLWTSLGVMTLTGVTAGTVYGLSAYSQWTRQQPHVDTDSVAIAEQVGPGLAVAGNVGLYASLGLVLVTTVLFFLPAEELVQHEVDRENLPTSAHAAKGDGDDAKSHADNNQGEQR